MMAKSLALRLCIGIGLISFVITALAAKKIEAAKENLNEVQQKIESLKKELNTSQDAHKDASDALKESETAISQAQKKLYQINQKQKENSTTLENLKKQTLAVNAQLADQQQKLSQQLNQQYLHGNQTYTQLILQSKDPNSIARDAKYYSYIAKARSELIEKMQGNLHKIQSLNEETAEKLQEVEQLKAKQMAEKKALELQKQEKAKIVKSLSQKIAMQRNEISRLKRDEKNLSSLVERLTKLASKPKAKKSVQASSRKNQTKSKQTHDNESNAIAKNEELPEESSSGINFASLKGKLRLPVRGELINRFGSSRADTGVNWKGLFIKAPEGNEVKSIASGRVVFADWMRGFGNLIIVDHSDGYMSLYGNNQALLKGVGDIVNSGDTIASVGNSGGNETHGLYYELRKNSVPIDPLSWSSLR
ncbi:MAG: peptidoglycan DD-metalloendopeptidase family protein [Methylophilus sp.]|nr:peptidoglycan DD-metalloendopeptidase family protein [Methylophilus sp.]